jgi:hypothetical protein
MPMHLDKAHGHVRNFWRNSAIGHGLKWKVKKDIEDTFHSIKSQIKEAIKLKKDFDL